MSFTMKQVNQVIGLKGLTGSYDSEKYVTSNNNILWVKDAGS